MCFLISDLSGPTTHDNTFMNTNIIYGFSRKVKDKIDSKTLPVFFLQLESLGQSELASRLTLNCQNSYVEPHKIRDIPVTIMDVSFFFFFFPGKIDALSFSMYMSRSSS